MYRMCQRMTGTKLRNPTAIVQVGDDSYKTWVGSGDLGVLQQTIPAALNHPEQSRYTAAGLSQRVGLGNESGT